MLPLFKKIEMNRNKYIFFALLSSTIYLIVCIIYIGSIGFSYSSFLHLLTIVLLAILSIICIKGDVEIYFTTPFFTSISTFFIIESINIIASKGSELVTYDFTRFLFVFTVLIYMYNFKSIKRAIK